MTVKVERKQGGDPANDARIASKVEAEIKKQVLASGKVEIFGLRNTGKV